MIAFYVFAAVSLWLGILSLRGGFRFAAYLQEELPRRRSDFTPFVTVFAPCRGVDEGFAENLSALFEQDYSKYEVIFVTDSAQDQSVGRIKTLINNASLPARLIIAGPAIDCGQKVHNLRIAVQSADARAEVFAFVDTDARPRPNWLQSLVAPLADESVGAATGYRWFVPLKFNFASQFRAVWNASIASALGADRQKNFCWGGSTAIRRSTFERLNMRERWRGTVSDDFTLTKALHDADMPIHFVPACLVPAVDDCSTRELFEFTNRQLTITRVYMPNLWKPVLLGSLLFCLAFFGGIAITVARFFNGRSLIIPTLMLLSIYVLGALKAHIRWKAVASAMPEYRPSMRRGWIFHLTLWPFASALFLWNALAAAVSRRIKWRGITYELRSAHEAVIIKSNL
ncbi:MAG TPA: glycosyltransferase family 2 protein [Pyrinomonadaceae bacterium]|nr:glycosyltransferase family 2 protein [Pyrinomonadaceae bacterium]